MTVKIKCKCGKTLRVPREHAGKKIACPGCKKCYRVAEATFEAMVRERPTSAETSQTASVARQPTPDRPSAESPSALNIGDSAPIDLDITPSQIDLLADVSASPSGLVDDLKLAGELGASDKSACPSCHAAVEPGAVLCVKCGTDLRSGRKVGSIESEAAAPALAYAGGRPSQKRLLDSQEPARGYWSNALHSFMYPISNFANTMNFAIIVGIALLQIPMSFVVSFGAVSIGILIGICIIKGWLAGLYLSIVQDTAAGSDDLPGIRMEDGPLEDIIKPGLKYMGAYACALAPAAMYLIGCATNLVPASMQSGLALLIWIILGIFIWPVFVLLFAFNALSMIVRLDLIFTTIERTILPYLALWLMLLVVGMGGIMAVAGPLLAQAGLDLPIPEFDTQHVLGKATFLTIELYLTIVAMRQIGLYYLHFKKRFTIELE